MRIFKYALIAMGCLVIVFGAALAYVAATFDPNAYKPQIVQLVKDKKQRTLRLEGDIRLAFWPSLGAKVAGVTLSEKGGGAEFLSLESAQVSVAVMPLLRGAAVVDGVRVTRETADTHLRFFSEEEDDELLPD